MLLILWYIKLNVYHLRYNWFPHELVNHKKYNREDQQNLRSQFVSVKRTPLFRVLDFLVFLNRNSLLLSYKTCIDVFKTKAPQMLKCLS